MLGWEPQTLGYWAVLGWEPQLLFVVLGGAGVRATDFRVLGSAGVGVTVVRVLGTAGVGTTDVRVLGTAGVGASRQPVGDFCNGLCLLQKDTMLMRGESCTSLDERLSILGGVRKCPGLGKQWG